MLVNSIFLSINGECCRWGQGSWAVFVRTAGCSLKCDYCDTKYAWEKGEELTVVDVFQEVRRVGKGIDRVVVTGGEPTEQEDLYELLSTLGKEDFQVSVETNGFNTETLLVLLEDFPETSFVVDFKILNRVVIGLSKDVLGNLKSNDFIKFVIGGVDEFITAERSVLQLGNCDARIYFSPKDVKNSQLLFDLMKNSSICLSNNLGISYQIHKAMRID